MPNAPHVSLAELKKLAPTDVRLLWVNDWYDGPLEAMVEHAGQRCLMVLHNPEVLAAPVNTPFRWILFRLSPAQFAEEERWHALFAENVGDHWCFHPETHPTPLSEESRDPERFYGPYRNRVPVDLRDSEVIGWLDEMPTS